MWDTVVGELTNQTQRLEAQVTELLTSGVTAPYKEVVVSLERNAKAVREIVQNKTAAVKLEQIQDLMHQITYVCNTNGDPLTVAVDLLFTAAMLCCQWFDVLPQRKAEHN